MSQNGKITPIHVMLYLVIAAFLLLLVYIVYNHDQERKHPHALEMLEKRYIDSVRKASDNIIKANLDSISAYYKDIDRRNDSIIKIDEQIREENQKLTKIIQTTHAKVNHVMQLPTDSLAKFFTDRYGNKTK